MARTPLRARILYGIGEFEEALKVKHLPVARAATAAIRDAAAEIKTEARADIRAAGFSQNWANALRVEPYPKGASYSVNAAALVWHKIFYAGVFEKGATIRGKPLMWVPLPKTPLRVGRERATPENMIAAGVRLFPIKGPRRTVLAAKINVQNRSSLKSKGAKYTLRGLKKTKANDGQRNRVNVAVPLFVGIEATQIRKRFNITAIVERAASRLQALYIKHFRDE